MSLNLFSMLEFSSGSKQKLTTLFCTVYQDSLIKTVTVVYNIFIHLFFNYHYTGFCTEGQYKLLPCGRLVITKMQIVSTQTNLLLQVFTRIHPLHTCSSSSSLWETGAYPSCQSKSWGRPCTGHQSVTVLTETDCHQLLFSITNKVNPTNSICQCCGRKLEYLERTHVEMGGTAKLHRKVPDCYIRLI